MLADGLDPLEFLRLSRQKSGPARRRRRRRKQERRRLRASQAEWRVESAAVRDSHNDYWRDHYITDARSFPCIEFIIIP